AEGVEEGLNLPFELIPLPGDPGQRHFHDAQFLALSPQKVSALAEGLNRAGERAYCRELAVAERLQTVAQALGERDELVLRDPHGPFRGRHVRSRRLPAPHRLREPYQLGQPRSDRYAEPLRDVPSLDLDRALFLGHDGELLFQLPPAPQ